MLTKIYLALLAISVILMGFFTWYAWSWLQSIGVPAAAVEGYQYQAGIGWLTLWASTLILLMIAAGALWTTKRAWALWVTFVYFAVFIVARSFWLEPAANAFKQQSGLAVPGFTGGTIMAAVSILGIAALAFLAQYAIIRLHRKTYEPDEPTPEPEETGPEM